MASQHSGIKARTPRGVGPEDGALRSTSPTVPFRVTAPRGVQMLIKSDRLRDLRRVPPDGGKEVGRRAGFPTRHHHAASCERSLLRQLRRSVGIAARRPKPGRCRALPPPKRIPPHGANAPCDSPNDSVRRGRKWRRRCPVLGPECGRGRRDRRPTLRTPRAAFSPPPPNLMTSTPLPYSAAPDPDPAPR